MKYRTPRSVSSKNQIAGCKRDIRYENVWLLYNYGTLRDFFFTKKNAIAEAMYQSGTHDMPEYYQILKGTITIQITPTP